VKKAIAMRWVKALRSGKYKQGTGHLKRRSGYCCLGVLCELRGVGFDGLRGTLPDRAMRWAGMSNPHGKAQKGPLHRISLAQRNDGNGARRHSFKMIAKLIERHWKEL
jgi:hypothetical protein